MISILLDAALAGAAGSMASAQRPDLLATCSKELPAIRNLACKAPEQ